MSATVTKQWPGPGRHGAVCRGASGAETLYARTVGTARRIRRVCRAHAAGGGWTGAATLRALADLAAARPGVRVSAILAEFATALKIGARQTHNYSTF